MGVIISLLRGVNVGGHGRIKMDALRSLYESIGLRDSQTYIQSGNVVFRSAERNLPRLAARIEDAIEKEFGFRPAVILRTMAELKDVIARNPFAAQALHDPARLLVTFLAAEPGAEARAKIRSVKRDAEDLRLDGRELYIYFPDGAGRSKLSLPALDKALNTPTTGRNWNTVTQLLQLAGSLEKAS